MDAGLATQQDGQTAHDAYMARRYFANLNGLRFICIALVLWHHAIPGDLGETVFFRRGYLGVDFFFVLSGYLITTLLLREAAASPTGRFSLRDFYIRRALRILPVYYLVITCVGAYYIFGKGQTDLLALWPHYYLFLANFLVGDIPTLAPTWSLSVEEQYYLVWPLLLMLLPLRAVVPALVGLVALNMVLLFDPFGFEPWRVGPLEFKMFTATYAPILLGSALAVLLNRKASFALFHAALSGRYTDAALLLLLAGFVAVMPEDMTGWPHLGVHLLMCLSLASILVREDGCLAPLLQNRVIARIGEVSYGIYLYHLIALDITLRILGAVGLTQSWLILFAYSVVSILIAEASFRFFERHFLKLRPGGAPKPRAGNT